MEVSSDVERHWREDGPVTSFARGDVKPASDVPLNVLCTSSSRQGEITIDVNCSVRVRVCVCVCVNKDKRQEGGEKRGGRGGRGGKGC
jgi:predicted nucleotidyltransferase